MHILTDTEREIIRPLQAISAQECGLSVAQIARQWGRTFGHNKRTTSGYVSNTLLRLEQLGVVCRLDDQKPIAWRLTAPL
jgi:predicted transcriptional regulator